jgi:hypothetical protein
MKGILHPLTLQPGGNTLKFVFNNGRSQVQPRIKYPEKYISKVQKECVEQGETLSEVYDITRKGQKDLVWKA